MVSCYRNTGRMNLCKAGITKISALLMCFPNGSDITAHGICRKIKYITISAAAKQYCMSKMSFEITSYKIFCNDAARFSIDRYHVEHLMTRIHFHITQCYLPFQCLVSADKQLLPGLSGCIKCTLYLCATK